MEIRIPKDNWINYLSNSRYSLEHLVNAEINENNADIDSIAKDKKAVGECCPILLLHPPLRIEKIGPFEMQRACI